MTPLETSIEKCIRRFDLVCLVRLLFHMGYSLDDILFCSHYSFCSQSSLIEAIEFRDKPRRATITLNLGLLGGQSVLPNYLFKQVHNDAVEARYFVEFFGFFDDRLLRRFLLAIYPELYTLRYKGWEAQKSSALHQLKLDNVVTLHWLAQLVFPELQVRMEKVALKRHIELGAPVLGKSRLGYQTVFGKRVELPVPGRRLTLITDEEYFASGQPWPHEIDRRLQNLVFPILRKVGLDLEVWLVIRTQGNWLKLGQSNYLGYEDILSDTLKFRRIRIFSGRLYDWQ